MEQNSRNPPEKEPLLTEKQAGEFLRVEVKTLQYWRWKGGGPQFIKIGRLVRYQPADLQAFIDANRKHNTCY